MDIICSSVNIEPDPYPVFQNYDWKTMPFPDDVTCRGRIVGVSESVVYTHQAISAGQRTPTRRTQDELKNLAGLSNKVEDKIFQRKSEQDLCHSLPIVVF